MTSDITIQSEGLTLHGHLARAPASAAPRKKRQGVIVVHGFPSPPNGAGTVASTLPPLADRIAAMDGAWTALALNLRGTGRSGGDFSLAGWMRDLRAGIDFMVDDEGVDGVYLAGFARGGSLSICAAGEDERVRGVAALGPTADFSEWTTDTRRFLAECRRLGMITSPTFPPDFDKWAREIRELRPLALVGKIPPRPLLLVHGSDDDVVPVTDSRVLADAAEGQCELRIITAGAHLLRHDPRAIAVLLGWLERQGA